MCFKNALQKANGAFCSRENKIKLGYLKDSNAAAHSVTAPA